MPEENNQGFKLINLEERIKGNTEQKISKDIEFIEVVIELDIPRVERVEFMSDLEGISPEKFVKNAIDIAMLDRASAEIKQVVMEDESLTGREIYNLVYEAQIR